MGKRVLVTSEDIPRVFENLESAAAGIGASETAISIAVREGRACKGVVMRYVDRVYLVRRKGEIGKWVLAKLNAHNTAFFPFEQGEASIKVKDVDKVKDITVSWYKE